MTTLTPVAVWTALTNLMPEDGVDFRSALSLRPLFQAILNRLEFLAPAATGGAVYATEAALVAALPPTAALRGSVKVVHLAGLPDQSWQVKLLGDDATYQWVMIN